MALWIAITPVHMMLTLEGRAQGACWGRPWPALMVAAAPPPREPAQTQAPSCPTVRGWCNRYHTLRLSLNTSRFYTQLKFRYFQISLYTCSFTTHNT